jgi:hypothetical protein
MGHDHLFPFDPAPTQDDKRRNGCKGQSRREPKRANNRLPVGENAGNAKKRGDPADDEKSAQKYSCTHVISLP